VLLRKYGNARIEVGIKLETNRVKPQRARLTVIPMKPEPPVTKTRLVSLVKLIDPIRQRKSHMLSSMQLINCSGFQVLDLK